MRMQVLVLGGVVAVLAFAGCSSEPESAPVSTGGSTGCQEGTLNCTCPTGVCNPGLTCVANLCVASAAGGTGGMMPGTGALPATTGGMPMGTGGMPPVATGGMPVATGGMPVATGGVVTATGGVVTATGGVVAATGGVVTATGGGGAATGGGGAATGGGGAATGGGGAGGAENACATMVTVTDGAITNFDDYDGVTALNEWGFSFNGDVAPVYAGLYGYDDATGSPVFAMVAGNAASTYAASASNTEASGYGGGLGLWMSCVDASSFSGIQFYVRGSTPLAVVTVTLLTEDTTPVADGGTCTAVTCDNPAADVPVTDTWTLVQIPWSDFTAGTGLAGVAVAATGVRATGLNFNVNLEWVEDTVAGTWVPVAAGYELAIDDVSFY